MTVDPDQRVAVWNADRSRTTARLPVQFLPDLALAQAPSLRSLGPYYVYTPLDVKQQFGNAEVYKNPDRLADLQQSYAARQSELDLLYRAYERRAG